jgi:ADP-L-glycero-D-manno-heptose 6-epimerase
MNGKIRLFNGSDNIYRDFIYIYDIISIIDYFFLNTQHNGIVNVGSSDPVSFESIADAMINRIGYGNKEYIDKPNMTNCSYQNFTKSDNTKLISMGYNKKIPSILEYINTYEF